MNNIDTSFEALINEIKGKSEEEIFEYIKDNFLRIPVDTQKSMISFFNKFNYWGYIDLNTGNYEEIEMKSRMLKDHADDFLWLYNNLGDYRSKKTLYAILNNFYNYNFALLDSVREIMYDDYFDLDLVKVTDDEVVVDLGAYIGDTALSYINNYGLKYKKMYCYEMTPDTLEYLKSNLKSYPNIEIKKQEVRKKCGWMYLNFNDSGSSANTLTESGEKEILVTTLDEDIKEKITMIKSDIEGMECQALKGAYNHILNDHPKLLISVYHNNEDLWKIKKMIKKIHPDYRLYLRYHGGNIFPTEIVLVCKKK